MYSEQRGAVRQQVPLIAKPLINGQKKNLRISRTYMVSGSVKSHFHNFAKLATDHFEKLVFVKDHSTFSKDIFLNKQTV